MSTPLRNVRDTPPLRHYPLPEGSPPPRDAFPCPGLPVGGATLPSLSLGAPRSHRKPTGRGRGIGGDDAVRSTDSDALLSRISAIRAGYLPPDEFSEALVSTTTQAQAAWKLVPGAPSAVPVAAHVAWRRPPVINVGTYLRCAAVDEVINAFVEGKPLPGLPPNVPITLTPFFSAHAERTPDSQENDLQGPVQIISLGAGSDSRFWRLKASSTLGPRVVRYIELDFPQITAAKVERILHSDTLSAPLKGTHGFRVSSDGHNLDADDVGYHLMACDVRDLVCMPGPGHRHHTHGGHTLSPSLGHGSLSGSGTGSGTGTHTLPPGAPSPSGFDPVRAKAESLRAVLQGKVDSMLPTIVVMECFLLYLDPNVAKALLKYVLSDLLGPSKRVATVSYDVVLSGQTAITSPGRPTVSEFGQVMLHNLAARGLEIPGAKAATWPGDHTTRFAHALSAAPSSAAAHKVATYTMALSTIWGQMSSEDKLRLAQVEGLDELEELELLLHHYTISVGQRT